MNLKEARRVVVGLDFSESGDAALSQALELSRGERDGELHVVHVAPVPFAPLGAEFGWEDPGASLAQASDRLRDHVEHELDAVAPRLGFDRVTLHVRVGPAAEAIARVAAEVDADMIVVGTHGRRGVRRYLLGSVAEATIRMAGCPVLVVRPKSHDLKSATGDVWEESQIASRP